MIFTSFTVLMKKTVDFGCSSLAIHSLQNFQKADHLLFVENKKMNYAKKAFMHATSLTVGVFIGSQYFASRMRAKAIELDRLEASKTQFEGAKIQKAEVEDQTVATSKHDESIRGRLEELLEKEHDDVLWPKYNLRLLGDCDEHTLELFQRFYRDIGLPSNTGQVNLFPRYLSVTDSRLRVPLFVAWTIPHLNNDKVVINSDRKYSRFQKSEYFGDVTDFNPTNEDYFSATYSRGHLVNCGDFTVFNQQAMNDTHLLANNIVPQDYDNNANYWLRMERFSRQLAEDFDNVHIIAGPAFVPTIYEQPEVKEGERKPRAPKGEVKHLIIGKNSVAVPTHLFRIIIAQKDKVTESNEKDTQYYAEAFLVPNAPVNKMDHLTKYSISLQELEEITGMRFLQKLEKGGKMKPLCCVSASPLLKYYNESQSPEEMGDDQEISNEKPEDNLCACNCDLPPWQDMDFQKVLWDKRATPQDIETKWNSLLQEYNWKPSKDIIRRKKAKLDELLKSSQNQQTVDQ